mmetsp:Transcript_54330/g.117586  ORF Transcript_54330/g.117586 Transcript_54330/m.117586 type:complete len:502 (-) Transcript_54330:71-1576(-)
MGCALWHRACATVFLAVFLGLASVAADQPLGSPSSSVRRSRQDFPEALRGAAPPPYGGVIKAVRHIAGKEAISNAARQAALVDAHGNIWEQSPMESATILGTDLPGSGAAPDTDMGGVQSTVPWSHSVQDVGKLPRRIVADAPISVRQENSLTRTRHGALGHKKTLGHKLRRLCGMPLLANETGTALSTKVDWGVLGISLSLFLVLSFRMFNWPDTTVYQAITILVWIAMAAIYCMFVFFRQGRDFASNWMYGYVLEAVFTLDNVFVYHFIACSYKFSRQVNKQALICVILWRFIFQFTFYMGLAVTLKQCRVLPYLLGMWLFYMGYLASCQGESDESDVDSQPSLAEKTIVSWTQKAFGNRIHLGLDSVGVTVTCQAGKYQLPSSFFLIVYLMLADFWLELDVTLAKIETIPNTYISFSSSVLASFLLPSLFLVMADLNSRFSWLKYGIAFCLVFAGLQMLLFELIELPALECSGLLVASLLLSMALSPAKGTSEIPQVS